MLNFKTGTPESTGVSSICITNFIMRLHKKGIPMHSLLLLHKDALITEGYYKPYTKDTMHRMFSISKSFTAIAIGLLAEEGKLSLEDKIVDYFPDKLPSKVHPWIASMTIRDMLMMRTCHASTTYKVNMKTDWVESFFTVPPTHPAGKLFHYDTSSAHVLCALAERLSGMPMLDYIKKKLAPLGLSNESYMISDPFGVSMGGSGLVATSMDILKFGYFLLKKGNICGEQLLSADYIETATSHLTDTLVTAPVKSEACGYGYQIWRNEKGGYVCYGMGGQLVIVLPNYDFICVTTADTQGIGGGNQTIYDAFYEEILSFVEEKPLSESNIRSKNTITSTENLAAHEQLTKLLGSLQVPPLEGCYTSPRMEPIHNRCFNIEENPQGFTKLSLYFANTVNNPASSDCRDNVSPIEKTSISTPSEGILSFTLNGQDCELPFGFGKLVTGKFPVYDMFYGASGIWFSEDTLYIKVHIMDEFVGSVHFELVFGDDDVTVFMRKQEESLFHEFNTHLYGKPILNN